MAEYIEPLFMGRLTQLFKDSEGTIHSGIIKEFTSVLMRARNPRVSKFGTMKQFSIIENAIFDEMHRRSPSFFDKDKYPLMLHRFMSTGLLEKISSCNTNSLKKIPDFLLPSSSFEEYQTRISGNINYLEGVVQKNLYARVKGTPFSEHKAFGMVCKWAEHMEKSMERFHSLGNSMYYLPFYEALFAKKEQYYFVKHGKFFSPEKEKEVAWEWCQLLSLYTVHQIKSSSNASNMFFVEVDLADVLSKLVGLYGENSSRPDAESQLELIKPYKDINNKHYSLIAKNLSL